VAKTFKPGTPEWRARADALLASETGQPQQWWWLSFADGQRPEGDQFLGVVIVRAEGFMHAVQQTHRAGTNPGGEVQAFPLPDEAASEVEPYADRLLSAAELHDAGLA
jgi:hypothetical protein